MSKTAVVTGAGSGVGEAVALALAKEGWRVAIIGRRVETLTQTISKAGQMSGNLLAMPCDIGNSTNVEQSAREIMQKLGAVEVLVNAAGTNAPKRSLQELSLKDYHQMIDTNLNGAYYCVQAFLPGMREQKSGTIVNVVSDAAKQASAKAGPAYVMSKFGLAGLTQSINAEERANGIRACAIFPGDIDTPLLDKRPNPPAAEARARMLHSEDIAACVMLAINLPSRAIVEEILVRPR
ncbi:SDR family oxidoreductase [Pedosphaera parvula]|uniref:Short-chain dehydrogenase/reductase SDR n=1 Tax=Pedosphaera parvula (strain Ellin514) TaxID=320771 RepID=B9XKJ5_PEDPL|nr:SDR family NAD(P)-dependent oxidoreductase [Pedosphaera parvula]EEF59665.1 short-chain dehydrogenase/reductase SDR [Pedosphaera parvula Ellin514]